MKKNTGQKTPLYPSGNLIIGTYDENHKPNAMALSWGGVCASEPPCVAISVRRERHTYKAIVSRGAFTVNIPSGKYAKEADLFGLVSGKDCDKFAMTGLTALKGSLVDAPMIQEFPISMECKVIDKLEIGSHVQFIGQVMACWVEEEVIGQDGSPDPLKVDPVVMMPTNGGYYKIGDKIGQSHKIGKDLIK